MTVEEKAIEQAANIFSNKGVWQCPTSFISGAKSSEAKAFHTKGMYSEEEEVRKIVVEVWEHAYNLGTCEFKDLKPEVIRDPLVWFEQNKKK